MSDPASARFFYPFLGRERTVSEAAAEVGCNLNTMHYRVTKMLEADILQIARVEERPGRPIKHYRSVRNAFFVPDSLTQYTDVEERFISNAMPVLRQVAKGVAPASGVAGHAGLCLYRDEEGKVFSSACELTTKGIVTLSTSDHNYASRHCQFGRMMLTDTEARAFSSELRELVRRYYQDAPQAPDEAATHQEYVFMLAFVPQDT